MTNLTVEELLILKQVVIACGIFMGIVFVYLEIDSCKFNKQLKKDKEEWNERAKSDGNPFRFYV